MKNVNILLLLAKVLDRLLIQAYIFYIVIPARKTYAGTGGLFYEPQSDDSLLFCILF